MKQNQFDELAKAMAQSVTRRETMKQFGFGLTTLALATLGLTTKAEAAKGGGGKGEGVRCKTTSQCKPGLICLKVGSVDGTCRPPSGEGGGCNANADCQPGLFCYFYGDIYSPVFGICRPYPSPLGGPCNTTAQCQPGLVCHLYGGIRGGYCTSP